MHLKRNILKEKEHVAMVDDACIWGSREQEKHREKERGEGGRVRKIRTVYVPDITQRGGT